MTWLLPFHKSLQSNHFDMNKLLSIVIPVYNMEKYVRQTLDSLVCDEMDALDIIIVNDGSVDGSLKIAEEWAAGFPLSATIVDKPNGGHGSAWNVGVSKACGKYLAFLDSDDWVADISAYLGRLSSAAADMVFNDCVIYNEVDGSKNIEKICGMTSGVHSLETDALPLRNHKSCRITNFHYCIYRTDLIKALMPLFHEKTSYDDLILSVAPLLVSQTYEYAALPFYVYRLGRGDQSMAPEVINRKIDQQETERKYAIDYAMKFCPAGDKSLKSKAVHEVVRALSVTYYNYVMLLDARRKKEYLDRWTKYVGENVPEPKKIVEYMAYVDWPCFYGPIVKLWHLYRRVFKV